MAREFIGTTNLAPLVEIFIWFGLTTSLLTVFVRVGIKWKVIRRIGFDDYLIALSLILAASQSITISIATANGLGTSLSSLKEAQLDSQLKARYAATFLFIASNCSAKLSLVSFLRALSPVARHRKLGVGLGVTILLWAVTSIISSAFQCRLPRPWDYLNNTCFDRVAWENYIAAVNVLTDVGLIILPVMIVASLKIAANKKITVLLAFASRLLVIAANLCLLAFLNNHQPRNDSTLSLWPIALCTQLSLNLSIITSCTVYLKPFLDSLESGFIQVGDLRRQNAEGYGYSQGTTHQNSEILSGIRGRLPNRASSLSAPQETYRLQTRVTEDVRISKVRNGGHALAFASPGEQVTDPTDWDANSRSQILQTRTWTVQGEDLEEETGVGHE